MKLTIEINDETLNQAIGNQLKELVSRLVHEKIKEQVTHIMATKLDRADSVIQKAVDEMLKDHLKRRSRYNDADGLGGYIDAAAMRVVKEKLK